VTDPKEKTQRSKRKDALKAEAHEVMRDKMGFASALNAISQCEKKLTEMAEADKEPSNGRIGALRTVLDSKWKRIDKILPSLQSTKIEGSGENGELIAEITVRAVAASKS